MPVDREIHKQMHDKTGFTPSKGDLRGGKYNNEFWTRLKALDDQITVKDVLQIRDDLMELFTQ